MSDFEEGFDDEEDVDFSEGEEDTTVVDLRFGILFFFSNFLRNSNWISFFFFSQSLIPP